MNRATRMLTVLGMGLMAGATVGATPAMATEAATPSASKSSTTVQVQQHRDRERIVGFYRSLRACERAGWLGERFNKWDDYDCERVRFGFRRGLWALEVEQDTRWNRPGHGHGPWGNGHGHWGNGHGNNGHGQWGNGHGNNGHNNNWPGHRDGPNQHAGR